MVMTVHKNWFVSAKLKNKEFKVVVSFLFALSFHQVLSVLSCLNVVLGSDAYCFSSRFPVPPDFCKRFDTRTSNNLFVCVVSSSTLFVCLLCVVVCFSVNMFLRALSFSL